MTHHSFQEYFESWRNVGQSINYNKLSNFKMSTLTKIGIGILVVGGTYIGGKIYLRRKSEERKVKRVLRREEQEAERLGRALGRIQEREEKKEGRIKGILSKIL